MSMDESSLEGTLDTVEFTLINLVKEYPELYNPQDPAYRDKQRKDLAWAEIARHMSKDGKGTKTKLNFNTYST